MSKKLLLASTIGAVAKSLSQVCESNDAVVAHFEQGEDLIRELVEGKYDALLVEHNFLEASLCVLL